MSANVSMPCHRINELGTHLHHRDRSAAVAIFTNRTHFLDIPHINLVCQSEGTAVCLYQVGGAPALIFVYVSMVSHPGRRTAGGICVQWGKAATYLT